MTLSKGQHLTLEDAQATGQSKSRMALITEVI